MRSGSGLEPTLEIFTALIGSAARDGDWELALRLFGEVEEAAAAGEISPVDLVLYNLMLHAVSRSPEEQQREAIPRLLRNMQDQGFSADVVTYNTLIDAACKRGEPDEGAAILLEMQRDIHPPVAPDIITYNTLLHGYVQLGQEGFDRAYELFTEAKSRGLQPDAAMFTVMMDAFKGSDAMVHELMANAKNDMAKQTRADMRHDWREEQERDIVAARGQHGQEQVESGATSASGDGMGERSGYNSGVQRSKVTREASQHHKQQRMSEWLDLSPGEQWLDLSPSGRRPSGAAVEETENQYLIDLHGLSQVRVGAIGEGGCNW
jgi:pentatricopeptide repeat protein